MQIKNKRTGVVWNITNEAHLKRLLDDPKHYEVVNQVTVADGPKAEKEDKD